MYLKHLGRQLENRSMRALADFGSLGDQYLLLCLAVQKPFGTFYSTTEQG